MIRSIRYAALGFLGGYLAYLPIMCVIELILYRRIDTEKAFYALYYPLGMPFLLSPGSWKITPAPEIVLTLIGGLLVFGGLVGAFIRSFRKIAVQPRRMSAGGPPII
jgi:hypothetical protein